MESTRDHWQLSIYPLLIWDITGGPPISLVANKLDWKYILQQKRKAELFSLNLEGRIYLSIKSFDCLGPFCIPSIAKANTSTAQSNRHSQAIFLSKANARTETKQKAKQTYDLSIDLQFKTDSSTMNFVDSGLSIFSFKAKANPKTRRLDLLYPPSKQSSFKQDFYYFNLIYSPMTSATALTEKDHSSHTLMYLPGLVLGLSLLHQPQDIRWTWFRIYLPGSQRRRRTQECNRTNQASRFSRQFWLDFVFDPMGGKSSDILMYLPALSLGLSLQRQPQDIMWTWLTWKRRGM